jgi:hypothetical protein
MIERRPEWKQASPRAQLVVTLMALEGHRSNLDDGLITMRQYLDKTDELTKWTHELLLLLPDCTWDGPG